MNDWGTRPVIVLSPYHPRLLATIRKLGFTDRKRAVLRMFRDLRRAGLKFVLIDATDIRRFGGREFGFYDGIHMRTPETRKLLRYVVERTGDLLKRPAAENDAAGTALAPT